MPERGHSITRQTVSVTADAATARALQPMLMDINEKLFVPIIENVFDEFDRSNAEVLIDRLTLDLGVMPLDGLSSVGAARLSAVLRAELGRLLAGTTPAPEPGVVLLTEEEAQLSILEHYLLNGLWPASPSRPAILDLDRLIAGIAAVQPADLGALLYRIGARAGVLERLVAQIDEATLELLVAVLEPEHAALIIGTIAESKAAHKEEPVTDMSETAFADRVWLTTLNYLVTEPGTQFNRREFVRSLLLGMARETGADYSEILATFRRALRRVAERRPVRSSLPAILLDLAEEDGATENLTQRVSFDVNVLGGSAKAVSADVPGGRGETESIDAFPTAEATGAIKRVLDKYAPVFRRYDLAEMQVPVASDTSQSHAPFTGQGARTNLQVTLARALARLDEPTIESLLRVIMPRAMVEESLFVESLRSHAGRAVDRSTFYAGVILAALEDRPIAFSELARDPAGPAPSVGTGEATPAARSVHRKLHRVLERAARTRIDEKVVLLLRDVIEGKASSDAAFERRFDERRSDVIDALHREVDAVDRSGEVGDIGGSTLRAALEYIAREVVEDAASAVLSKRKAGRAAVLGILKATLQSIPADVRPSRKRIDAVLESGAHVRRDIDVATAIRLLRESFETITTEVVDVLRHSLSALDQEKSSGARSGGVVRAAIDEILRENSVAAAVETRGEWWRTTVEAAVVLLQAMPPDAVLSMERIAAILMATSARSGPRRLDAAFVARLIRDSLAVSVTPAIIEALQRCLDDTGFASNIDPPRRAMLREAIGKLRKDERESAKRRRLSSRSAARRTSFREAAEEFLRSGRIAARHGTGSGGAWLTDALFDLMAEEPARAVAAIRAGAARRRTAAAWSRRLPPALLARLAAIIEPRRHRSLIETAERLAALLRNELAATGKAVYRRRILWAFILRHSARHVGKAWQPGELLASFMREEVAPRLGDTAAFAAMAVRMPGGEVRDKADRSERNVAPGPAEWTVAALSNLFRQDTKESRQQALALLRAALTDPVRREALACALSPAQFEAVFRLFDPRRHKQVRDTAVSLFAALMAADAHATVSSDGAFALQRFLFDFASEQRGRSWNVDELVHTFFRQVVVAHTRRLSSAAGAAFLQSLFTHIEARGGNTGMRGIVRAMAADRDSREAMAAALSSAQFEATLRVLEPRRYKLLRETGALLFSALAAVDKSVPARFGGAAALQRFLFGFVTAHSGKSRSVNALIAAYFHEIAAVRARRLGGGTGVMFLQNLAGVIEARAGTAGLRGVAQAMRRLRPTLIASAMKAEPDETAEAVAATEISDVALKPPVRPPASYQKAFRAPIYIDNAGLVLAGPFIPHLFRTLGMLEQTERGALKLAGRDGATRAVHLLQYLVTLRTATPEPLLVLNKILAGLPTGAVVGAGLKATEVETGLCDKLLGSMLANWPALSTGTSVAGLQSTFMQREGRLTFEDDKWKLRVERKTLDVLVDQVPWGFRIIYASWMPQPLHVEW